MPAAAKTATTPAAAPKKAAAPATPVAAPAVATESAAPAKKTATKAAAPAAAEPVVAAPAAEVAAPAEGGATEESNLSGTQLIISKMQTQIAELTSQLHASTGALKTLTTAMKSLEKEYAKERKELLKKAEKHTRKTKSNRNPSGFAKSSPISDELADFLGMPKGSELARTEATRRINAYIKANNLQNPDAKTIILPDAKLKALLAPPEGAVVKYFNLQSFLKRHFGTASTPVATAS